MWACAHTHTHTHTHTQSIIPWKQRRKTCSVWHQWCAIKIMEENQSLSHNRDIIRLRCNCIKKCSFFYIFFYWITSLLKVFTTVVWSGTCSCVFVCSYMYFYFDLFYSTLLCPILGSVLPPREAASPSVLSLSVVCCPYPWCSLLPHTCLARKTNESVMLTWL